MGPLHRRPRTFGQPLEEFHVLGRINLAQETLVQPARERLPCSVPGRVEPETHHDRVEHRPCANGVRSNAGEGLPCQPIGCGVFPLKKAANFRVPIDGSISGPKHPPRI